MAQKLFEIEEVFCGNCQVCVLGNASLSRRLAQEFPDWRPGRVTQISLMGMVGQTSVAVECSYSPTKRTCRKRIVAVGEEEDLVLGKIISILEGLSEARKQSRPEGPKG